MNKKESFWWLEKIIDIFYWIRIFISPTLLGLIFGGIIFASMQNIFGIILGSIVFIVGIIIGFKWAEKARKTIGTVNFSARPMNIPEINPWPKDATKEKKDI
jgi:hypothetical protein